MPPRADPGRRLLAESVPDPSSPRPMTTSARHSSRWRSSRLGLPAMVRLAPTHPDQTRDGYGYAEACRILAAEGVCRPELRPRAADDDATDRRGSGRQWTARSPPSRCRTARTRPLRRCRPPGPGPRSGPSLSRLSRLVARASRWRNSRSKRSPAFCRPCCAAQPSTGHRSHRVQTNHSLPAAQRCH